MDVLFSVSIMHRFEVVKTFHSPRVHLVCNAAGWRNRAVYCSNKLQESFERNGGFVLLIQYKYIDHLLHFTVIIHVDYNVVICNQHSTKVKPNTH